MTPEQRWELIEGWILKHEERHDRLEEDRKRHEERMAQLEEEHSRQKARIDARLRRAIRLAIDEGRRERAKRRELDEKITQLAAAQLITEEKMQELKASMQAFLDWSRHRGNGHSGPA